MRIIADGGSTKTSWCLVDERGERSVFKTEGYNPFYVSVSYIVESLSAAIPDNVDRAKVSQINYYGAGVHDEDKATVMRSAFGEVFVHSRITVGHDMLAAARALLGNKPGFAAILGTGTNTCVYDGENIVANTESGGFIMGDEGSGGHIGKHLLIDFLRGYMPPVLHNKLREQYQLKAHGLLDRIYSQPFANRYVAGFSEFLSQNIHHEYCYDLVKACFTDFFENLVSHYPNYKTYTFNCIGSVGYNFKSILEETALEFGMAPGIIVASPMEGLVDYHQSSIQED